MTPSRDPFANFERMRREIDELFGDVVDRGRLPSRRGFSPRVDVFYCGDPPKAVVKADLAGVDVREVALEIRGRQLLIAGERRSRATDARVYQQLEIEHGPFRRVVSLGVEVDPDAARAVYRDGILTVELPVLEPSAAARTVRISKPGEHGS